MDEIRFQAKIRSELSKRPNGKIIDMGSGLLKVKADGEITGIKAEWVGVLVNEGLQCFYGKFTSVNVDANEFIFTFDDFGKHSRFKAGETIYYFDTYWGERIEIVLDRHADWVEKKFSSAKAIKLGNMIRKLKDGETPPEGAAVIDGGWDHEHCEMCMETLDAESESGFQNKYGQWICRECFANYFANGSLGFLE